MNAKFLLLASIACAAVLHSEECAEKTCITQVNSNQIWIRRTEPKGIGYREGYTTLQAFVMNDEAVWGFYPYADVRGHIFNNGRYAINAGAGARYLGQNRIYGANAYYDGRGTKRITFNQLSFGFETIGAFWDFFANGYVVIGRKNSPRYNPAFDHFENHFAYIRSSTDSALSGVDAKARFHFVKEADWDAYLDVGGYYYHGSFGTNLGGGRTAVGAVLYEYFFAEASASYDNVFKWIGQGIFGFRMPVGAKIRAKVYPCQEPVLPTRLMQIPDHNEIIPVKKNHRLSEAIDPLTGDPFFFWFVNNRSNSLGTFESPFPFLAQAQNASEPRHIIYVFEGDGTATNMAEGITLKDYQQLLGSGISHGLNTTLGTITLPQLTPGYPVISNTLAMGSGVVLAANNIVSGMHIDSTQYYGIDGVGAPNARLENNIITNSNLALGSDRAGINIAGPGMAGTYTISGNLLYETGLATRMIGVYLKPQGTDVCTVVMSQNYISTPKDGMEVHPEGASSINATILSNVFEVTTDEQGLFLTPHDTSRLGYSVQNNIFRATSNGIGTGLGIQGHNTSFLSGVVANNQFIDAKKGFEFVSGGHSQMSLNASNNTFSGNSMYDFYSKISVADTNSFLCAGLQNNSAPAIGFVFENNDLTSTLNITRFINNTGPVTQIGGPITTDPDCPF